jgi:hypothetical protein
MQSYYGTSPAAKGFEVAQRKSELQLPEGIVGTRNGKIPLGAAVKNKKSPFRRAAQIDRLTA